MATPKQDGYYWFKGKVKRDHEVIDIDELVIFSCEQVSPRILQFAEGGEFVLGDGKSLLDWAAEGEWYGPVTLEGVRHLRIESGR